LKISHTKRKNQEITKEKLNIVIENLSAFTLEGVVLSSDGVSRDLEMLRENTKMKINYVKKTII